MNKYIKDICRKIYEECDSSDFKDRTVLICGANGLIGGFLADFFHFLNQEYQYNTKLVLSSLSDKDKASRLKSILREDPKIKYLKKDLSILQKWEELLDFNIDYCFFCSGYAQPAKFLAQPLKTILLNSNGVHNTFHSVFHNNKDAKCVYLSSSEVYAASTNSSSHKEDDNIVVSMKNKRNPYILGKLAGETVVNAFRSLGRKTVSVRVSLCYGPGVSSGDNRVMSELARKGLSQSENVNLFDDGSAARRYTHISDFVKMLLNITLFGTQPVYNVGGEEETTIYNMATHIAQYYNKSVKKGQVGNSVAKTAPKKVWVSMKRYKEEFGDLEQTPFKKGLLQFLEWYEGELKNED